MEKVTLNATSRDNSKGKNGQLRRAGKIPAIIYGKGLEASVPIMVDEKEFVLLSRKGLSTLLFNINLEGKKYSALVKDYQMHIITRKMQHVDFYSVDEQTPIEVEIPFILTGDAKGVKMGGRLEQHLYKIKVKAIPENIPHEIKFDVSDYDIGAHLHVKDLKAPKGIEYMTNLETSILNVRAPRAVAEPTPAATAATPTPAEGGTPAATTAPAPTPEKK